MPKRNSNLKNTPIEQNELSYYNPPLTPDFTRSRLFTINQKYHKRPDLLAYDEYGDSHFWWVFSLYNRNQLLDPINDFVLGLRIYIPNRNYIEGI